MAPFASLVTLISLIAKERSSEANLHSHSADVAIRKINRSATDLIVKQVLKPLVCSVWELTLSRGFKESFGLIFNFDRNALQ